MTNKFKAKLWNVDLRKEGDIIGNLASKGGVTYQGNLGSHILRMNKKGLNLIWIAILAASLIGAFVLFKAAYANPLGLPDYALKSAEAKEAYSFAKSNQEKLDGLPCNCGCMSDSENHGGRAHTRGLIDCFMIGDVNNGGSWDEHASSCGLCMGDTLFAKKMYEQGSNKEEIRAALEERYSTQTFSNETIYGM